METPIECLELQLNSLKYIANSRTHHNRKKAKELIPAYEKAIQVLKSPPVCEHEFVAKEMHPGSTWAAAVCRKCGFEPQP